MSQNADPRSTEDLITHIIGRYHDVLRRDMPPLIALSQKVERVHSAAPQAPLGLADLLTELFDEMSDHMQKEEMILFPAMKRGGMPGIMHPIAVMRADHDDHAQAVVQIRAVTGDLVLPAGACNSWTRLYAEVGQMLNDLEDHMRLENDILFPRFEAAA